MKKVLLIPSWYPTKKNPILGSFFREQAEFLNQSGKFNVQILYGEIQSEKFIKTVWLYFLAQFGSIIKLDHHFSFVSPKSFYFRVPNNRRIPESVLLYFARKLHDEAFKEYLKFNEMPDLIHAQSGMDAGIYAHFLSKKHNVPFLILEHQVFIFHYYSKLKAKLVLQAFAAASKTAAVSYDERRQILMNQSLCNPEVIWNFVDESRYEIDLSKRRKKFTVITILNSLPIKGAVDFLDAMVLLRQANPEIEFIMVGKGADEHSADRDNSLFIQKSKELGVFEMGEFLPYVPREDISNVLNEAHVFVSPTIQEPHGIAVREAMMCGLPIISTANGGVEDSITPETGIVVPVRRPQDMVNAILKVKENYSNYSSTKIRELAIDQCGKTTFLNKMVQFYNVP
ncbi:Glycosyltransferase involved in cell wall bisynthesis [Algoriphagus locisalis]|uniref:Glycosyltransferase involved in cell wall bisynthesis n=1 Tax=Algoriphagus locisalis TaxID=305507 RepID=A0A1I6XUL4_9BACT|nr:glycosyltransferase [Algoriphagus locisalis]SFT41797.1 Glycosyltransferase involved in cell wall bisynthesis [Algoriphagus locisalis]